MPISSGNSQGSMTMTIQPQSHSAPSGNMSVLTANQLGALSLNSLVEDHLNVHGINYQNVYQNPDLETALLARGFSQMRPEILGVFEFTPPVTEDILTAGPGAAEIQMNFGWTTRPTYGTNAAELFDLQCQLKQLRYTEALKFLSQQMNLSTEEVGAGIQLNPNDEGGIYLEPFNAEMGAAKDILDWLTIAYNSVTKVLEAMDIKSAPHIDIVNSNSKIYESLSMYDPDAITIAPENLTLQEYMTSSSGLEIPDGWWSSATQTQIVAQLILDVVMRLIYPVKAYAYPPGWMSDSETGDANDVEFNPGTVLGLDYLYNSGLEETITGAILQLRYLSVDQVLISESSSMGGAGTFSKGDFQSLRMKFSDTDEIGLALFAFASDLMIRAALERDTVDILSGISNTANSNEILKKIYGVSPSTHNIANISPNSDPDSLIMRLMPKDVDPDTSVDRKISTFQYSSHSMSVGTFPLRTGKSYFLDDIVTKDVADVMVRLGELSSNLTYIKEKLVELTEAFNSPDSIATHQPYIEEGKMLASSLVWDVFRQGSAVINQVLLAIEAGTIDPFVKICVATAAAENSNIAWHLFKYVIYKAMYKLGKGDAWKVDALRTATALITELLSYQPGLTGEIDKMNRTNIDMGGGNVTVSASEDTGVSGVYAGIQLSELHSITTPEMLAVFDNDIELADYHSGIGDLFDIGFVGMNVWINRLRGTYGLLPSSLHSLTGPNLKASYLGGLAICFFWQLQVYREALGFKQVAGEAHLSGQAVEGGA